MWYYCPCKYSYARDTNLCYGSVSVCLPKNMPDYGLSILAVTCHICTGWFYPMHWQHRLPERCWITSNFGWIQQFHIINSSIGQFVICNWASPDFNSSSSLSFISICLVLLLCWRHSAECRRRCRWFWHETAGLEARCRREEKAATGIMFSFATSIICHSVSRVT